jgi:hypothetical protein
MGWPKASSEVTLIYHAGMHRDRRDLPCYSSLVYPKPYRIGWRCCCLCFAIGITALSPERVITRYGFSNHDRFGTRVVAEADVESAAPHLVPEGAYVRQALH